MVNSFKDAETLARNYNTNLLATDKRFRKNVFIEHADGSYFLINNAFFMHINLRKLKLIVCFSEHFMPLKFYKDDLCSYFYLDEKRYGSGRLIVNLSSTKVRTKELK